MNGLSLFALRAQFIVPTGRRGFKRVTDISRAKGVVFHCPKCYRANVGTIGTHSIIVWSPKVDAGRLPGPGRWRLKGTSLADLTLLGAEGESSSVQLHNGCKAHFHVRDGGVIEVA